MTTFPPNHAGLQPCSDGSSTHTCSSSSACQLGTGFTTKLAVLVLLLRGDNHSCGDNPKIAASPLLWGEECDPHCTWGRLHPLRLWCGISGRRVGGHTPTPRPFGAARAGHRQRGRHFRAPLRAVAAGSAPSGAAPRLWLWRRRLGAASPVPAPGSLPQSRRRRLDGSGAEPSRAASPPRPIPTRAGAAPGREGKGSGWCWWWWWGGGEAPAAPCAE